MRSQQRLRVEPCEDLLEHIDELNLQRWMQEKLRLVDQNQAVAANGAEDVDDHVGEQTLSGTEQQRLVVPEERDTVFEQDHLAQSLGVQVVDLTRRNGDVELVLVAFHGFRSEEHTSEIPSLMRI